MHMMTHVKVRPSTTYHMLLAVFGEIPIELHTLKLTMGFQQRLTHAVENEAYFMLKCPL